jgi:hypothetical protein
MTTSRRASWSVSAVNGLVAGLVLVLVAVLALVVQPPAPPGIAAFAPQAARPITKAPPDQSAQFGNGQGRCDASQVCSGPSATPKASTAASAAPTVSPPTLGGPAPAGLQCFAWPDGAVTQTFDPQSPPCVSTWDDSKGNGGATSQGVTGTEIKVALPVTSTNSTWPGLKPLVDFFNTRFQFYGRQLKVVPVHSVQADQNISGPWNDPVAQRADASQIAAGKPFATFDFFDPISESSTLPVFLDAMARAKIVSISGGDITSLDSMRGMQGRAPYAWSYFATTDELMRNLAVMTCRQLVGRAASHAPDPGLRQKTRKFAVFLPTDDDLGGPMPGLNSFLGILDSCGVHDPKVVRQHLSTQNTTTMAAGMQQLKSEGVTSVIFLPFGGNGAPQSPLIAAQRVGFRPEWVLIGWYNYNTAFMLNDPPQETSGAFGLAVWNKQPPLPNEMWNQAASAMGAGETAGTLLTGRPFYQELLLLASGIQMAGPKLTPQTFAAALHDTAFPNPGAAGAPFYQGTVGFPGSSPFMVGDYSPFWLDTRTSGTEVRTSTAVNESRAFCMVGLGRRWDEDSWPASDAFYTGGCR